MADFELLQEDGTAIEIVTEIPASYAGLRMAGCDGAIAKCGFGDLLFFHHAGEGFDIWKSTYDIKRDGVVKGRINRQVLELSIMYENSFSIDWNQVTKGKLDMGKIEMYYAPGAENTAWFKGGTRFSTFDIHFQPSMLEPFAQRFPLLDAFMTKIEKGEPARLFDAAQFISPQMEQVVREMLQCSLIDALAPRYYDGYVNVLLVLLLEKISGFGLNQEKYSVNDIAMATEAKRILSHERVNDKDEVYTIAKLCRRLGTNPYKLKKTFKHCFQMSIGKYRKKVFMEYAQMLLVAGDSIDEVALKLGYGTAQNFSTAFKNYFKYALGYIRKKQLK